MKSYRRWIRRLVGPSLLNGINHLSHLEDRLFDLEARRAQLAGVILQEHFRELFAKDPGAEFQIFSQNGEDGILLGLLNQTGAPTKRFVEIGIENARECNTAVAGFCAGLGRADARGRSTGRGRGTQVDGPHAARAT